MRVTILRAFAIALLASLVPVLARAADTHKALELCPAGLGEMDAVTSSLYSFDIVAPTPRTVQGTLAFETGAGWFRVPFGPLKLEPAIRHFADTRGHQITSTAPRSPVQYVNFGRPIMALKTLFMENGAADVGAWKGVGLYRCSPQPAHLNDYEPIGAEKAPYFSIPAGAHVIRALSVAPILRTDCAAPYVDAKVVKQAQAIYPFFRKMGPAVSMILVTIDVDGRLVDAYVFRSSGYDAFDKAAMEAARLSTYSPKIAYCQPVVGQYLFRVTFE